MNVELASKAGVSADIVYSDANSGLMISRNIDGIETMTPDLFCKRDGAASRAGLALKQLHCSKQAFEFRFELFQMIDEYLEVLSTQEIELPEGYTQIVKAAEPIKKTLAKYPANLAPCHNDPLCENFLDDGEKMWIIDWEYSGMNDPLWDLGDLSVEAGFSEAQDLQMMTAYCCGKPDSATMGRMIIYKAICDLLWTLWGLIQHAEGNPAEDFMAYAVARFERCKLLMTNQSFATHLQAIKSN